MNILGNIYKKYNKMSKTIEIIVYYILPTPLHIQELKTMHKLLPGSIEIVLNHNEKQ